MHEALQALLVFLAFVGTAIFLDAQVQSRLLRVIRIWVPDHQDADVDEALHNWTPALFALVASAATPLAASLWQRAAYLLLGFSLRWLFFDVLLTHLRAVPFTLSLDSTLDRMQLWISDRFRWSLIGAVIVVRALAFGLALTAWLLVQ